MSCIRPRRKPSPAVEAHLRPSYTADYGLGFRVLGLIREVQDRAIPVEPYGVFGGLRIMLRSIGRPNQVEEGPRKNHLGSMHSHLERCTVQSYSYTYVPHAYGHSLRQLCLDLSHPAIIQHTCNGVSFCWKRPKDSATAAATRTNMYLEKLPKS